MSQWWHVINLVNNRTHISIILYTVCTGDFLECSSVLTRKVNAVLIAIVSLLLTCVCELFYIRPILYEYVQPLML